MILRIKKRLLMSRRNKVIISGGGTGGHIFPAIAIADALREKDNEIEILFVGAKGKMEMERVPAAGYPIEGLWISGFQRKLTVQNLMFPLKLFSSLLQARKILKRFGPDIAIGVGGFASGPLLQMAVRSKVKTAIQEQNSFPGATNRILAKQVNRIFTAYPNMKDFFPQEKVSYLGNPVRASLREASISPKEAKARFGLDPEKKTILIFGGSLGAGALNAAMDEATGKLKEREDIQFIWQTGKFYESKYRNSATARLQNVKQLTFLNEMEVAYAAADLVVCRAGALTISELSLLGKASILVPSPNVAEDHQNKNSRALSDHGAAIHLHEKDIDSLFDLVFKLIEDENALQGLKEKILEFAKPNAAQDIADEILKLIQK